MKIIMTETMEKIGKAGQVINVKDGFARNFLFPKKLAIIASPANLKKIALIEAEAQASISRKLLEYKENVRKIKDLQAVFSRRADQEGKLFGSVSEVDLLNFLAKNEIHLEKNNIILEKHLKHIGEWEVDIVFTNEIKTKLKVTIDVNE